MIILLIWIVIWLAAIFYLFSDNDRIQKVYRYRVDMIERISVQNRKDLKAAIEYFSTGHPFRNEDYLVSILLGNFSSWRYDEYNAVSFGKMVWHFWKPLDSFYPRDPARSER